MKGVVGHNAILCLCSLSVFLSLSLRPPQLSLGVQIAPPKATFLDILPCHIDPKAIGPANHELKCRDVTQNKSFLFLSCSFQVFCYSKGKLMITKSHLFKFLPPPNSTALRTKPLTHSLWGWFKLQWATDMDEIWKHCAKWSKPDTKGQILCDLN
jgi:hypothetical protein